MFKLDYLYACSYHGTLPGAEFGDRQPLLLLSWELPWGFGVQGTSCPCTTSPHPPAGPQAPLPFHLSPWELSPTAAQPQSSGSSSLCSTLPSLDPRESPGLTGDLGSVYSSAIRPRRYKCIDRLLLWLLFCPSLVCICHPQLSCSISSPAAHGRVCVTAYMCEAAGQTGLWPLFNSCLEAVCHLFS